MCDTRNGYLARFSFNPASLSPEMARPVAPGFPLVALMLFTVSSFCAASADDNKWPLGQVLELNSDNLALAFEKFEHILVEFYAPWCGHCQRLAPELDLAAKELEEHVPVIAIAKIDVEKHTRIASKYGISVYPTVKVFVNGTPTDYQGPRKADSVISYMRRLVGPPVTVLYSESALEEFVEAAGGDETIFIGFALQQAILEKQALIFKTKALFAVIDDFSDKVMFDFDFNKKPSVVALHKKYNEQHVFYGPFEGALKVTTIISYPVAHADSDLREFVRMNLLPLVTPLTYSSVQRVKDDGRMVALTIVRGSKSEESVAFLKILKAAAPAHRAFVFAFVDASEWPSFVRSFNVGHKTPLPVVVVWDSSTSTYYPADNPLEFTGEGAGSHITRLLNEYGAGESARHQFSKAPLMARILDTIGGAGAPFVFLAVVVTVALLPGVDWGALWGRDDGKQLRNDSSDGQGWLQQEDSLCDDSKSGAKDQKKLK